MTSVTLYRWTLALPLALPLLLRLVAGPAPEPGLLGALATMLWFSLLYGGWAYLLLGGGLLVWTHGRSEAEVRRAFNLAPLLMLPLVWIPVTLPLARTAWPDLADLLPLLGAFTGYVLVFGYGYVLLSHGIVSIAKRAGWVTPVPLRYGGPDGTARLGPGELADQLERLLAATGWTEPELAGQLELVPIGEPALDEIRKEAMRLSLRNVGLGGDTYFSREQRPVVERWIERLRAMEASDEDVGRRVAAEEKWEPGGESWRDR